MPHKLAPSLDSTTAFVNQICSLTLQNNKIYLRSNEQFNFKILFPTYLTTHIREAYREHSSQGRLPLGTCSKGF